MIEKNELRETQITIQELSERRFYFSFFFIVYSILLQDNLIFELFFY